MVVQELQSVALFYQIAIGIVSKADRVLSGSPPSCVVGKADRYRLDTKRKKPDRKGDTVWKNLLIFLRIKNDLAKLFYLLNKMFLENVFY